MIVVRNTGDENIVARVGGQDHVFPAGEDTPCEDDVARHVFGYGEENKDAALLRLGWLLPGQPREKGLERLEKIIFKKGTVRIEIEDERGKRSAA